MATYNGHKSRNYWNVSLWLNNDEGFYRYAKRLCSYMTKDAAADRLARELDGQRTPDGARYSRSAIRAALVGI